MFTPETVQKQKAFLVDAIVKKAESQAYREMRYNELDPCTLESLDDIHDTDYIEWTQQGHRFGARKQSLVRNNQFIVPWAVDFHTKTYIEANEESFRYAKRSCDTRDYCRLFERNPIESVTTSFNTWFLFEVQSLVGTCSYCEGNVIEKLLNEEDMAVIFSNYKQLYEQSVSYLARRHTFLCKRCSINASLYRTYVKTQST